MNNTDTSKKELKKVHNFISIIGFAGALFLAFTSGLWVYFNFQQKIIGLPDYLSIALIGGCIALCYVMIDFGNGSLIKLRVKSMVRFGKEEINNQTRALKYTTLILTMIALLRLGVSISLSYMASPDLGEGTAGQENTRYYVEQVETKEKFKQEELKNLSSVINDLKKTENQRIKAARLKGDNLIKNAVKKGSTSWQSDYHKHKNIPSGWFWTCKKGNRGCPPEYVAFRQTVKSAINQKELLITEAKNEIIAAQKNYATYKSNGSESETATLLSIAEKEQNRFTEKVDRRTSAFYVLDFFAAFVVLFCAILLALIEIAMGEQEEKKLSKVNQLSTWWNKKTTFFQPEGNTAIANKQKESKGIGFQYENKNKPTRAQTYTRTPTAPEPAHAPAHTAHPSAPEPTDTPAHARTHNAPARAHTQKVQTKQRNVQDSENKNLTNRQKVEKAYNQIKADGDTPTVKNVSLLIGLREGVVEKYFIKISKG